MTANAKPRGRESARIRPRCGGSERSAKGHDRHRRAGEGAATQSARAQRRDRRGGRMEEEGLGGAPGVLCIVCE